STPYRARSMNGVSLSSNGPMYPRDERAECHLLPVGEKRRKDRSDLLRQADQPPVHRYPDRGCPAVRLSGCPAVHAELVVDVRQVRLDGGLADEQRAADLPGWTRRRRAVPTVPRVLSGARGTAC